MTECVWLYVPVWEKISMDSNAAPDSSEILQRMLNAVEPGSYIRPHRHVTPPKPESVIVLSGTVGYVRFDDGGVPVEAFTAGAGGPTIGFDTRAGVWHTYFALVPGTVVYEAKPGPYKASTDKEFPSWRAERFAPPEGRPDASEYLDKLVRLVLEKQ